MKTLNLKQAWTNFKQLNSAQKVGVVMIGLYAISAIVYGIVFELSK